MNKLEIGDRRIGEGHPTYFIADISANHDGDLERARTLIHLAAEAGANAAKFQNFRASWIVSEKGFSDLGGQLSHQSKWKKSVFQVYKEASLPWEWTPVLRDECAHAGIHYLSTPYDLDAVDMLEPYVPAFKIGSGDINWLEMLDKVASKEKVVILATGASALGEVQQAVLHLLGLNPKLVVMQCNTNYTASMENFRHIHLNVLRAYRTLFPAVILGLSDHTPGHATVLGAVALGARVVEKHFSDDTNREGPDHLFSMDPRTWREMVMRTRELEMALGDPNKRVADNERETAIVQRRCLRASRDVRKGTVLTRDLIDILRPAPEGSIPPDQLERVLCTKPEVDVKQGECFQWSMLRQKERG